MCGIFGYVKKGEDLEFLHKANYIQRHRGPDGNGISELKVGEWNIGFAHQRLSIIDLSNAANQPMKSINDENMITYNGEIYNYKELISEECLSTEFGDTRVLFEVLQRHGISYLKKLNGMWAFAFLKKNDRELVLSRDRFGEKPLYYYKDKNCLFFASELKTLLEILPKRFGIDVNVLGQFLLQGLTNFSQRSIFKDIQQVKPGTSLLFDLSKDNLSCEIKKYWKPELKNYYEGTFRRAKEEIYDVFENSINLRLRSDVPLGILLSGGIDSSAIASLAKNQIGDNLYTLSAIGDRPSHDERFYIRTMNKFLNAKDNIVEISPDATESFSLMEKVTYHNDFPISDFSNVMHYKLMQYSKQIGLKVVLSGQGADESFCGYRKYLGFYAQNLLRNKKIFKLIGLINGFIFNRSILNQFNFAEARRYLGFKNHLNVMGEAMEDFIPVDLGLKKNMSLGDRQLFDLLKASVPALTHYEDRMSMANGVEIRLPFLDHRLVELALCIPNSFKLTKGWTKYILREAASTFLPQEIAWRKDKQGFLNPQSEWLKKEWKEKVLELTSENSLSSKYGFINSKKMQKKYRNFCLGKQIWHREILSVISLEIWLRKNHEYLSL